MKHFLVLLPLLLIGTTVEAQSAGEALFMENCVACHGTAGRGDGPLAAGLATKPANMPEIAAPRNGVWPVLEIMAFIEG